MTPEIIASIGLALDIIGVILIWKFGLGQPMHILDADGTSHAWQTGDPNKRVFNISMDRIGLVLLIAGFTLQLISHWMPQL